MQCLEALVCLLRQAERPGSPTGILSSGDNWTMQQPAPVVQHPCLCKLREKISFLQTEAGFFVKSIGAFDKNHHSYMWAKRPISESNDLKSNKPMEVTARQLKFVRKCQTRS